LPAIRRAAAITYTAFRALPKYIVLGMTERQLAWRMGRLLEQFGSQRRAFPVIAAFGAQAAQPHHKANARPLRVGDMIKVDAGAVYRQMRGDVTRTWFFGTPPALFVRRYRAVYAAQQKAFSHFRAGYSGTSIDAVARKYLRQQHLGKFFIHSLGHGVGRAIHQPPFLTPRPKGQRVLRVGEVVTNEPGVYEPDWGGIRIEDMVEITARGPKWLGQAPRRLQEIVLKS
jgi:Xaa-Pro aminopeptidase